MSIPKEPRQLMINVMYLVLTALLALNVSAEIFNAFEMVDKGLIKANDALDAANRDLPAEIIKGAKKKPELATYADRVDKVSQISKEGSDYIKQIMDSVIDEAGDRNKVNDSGDYILMENGTRELKGKRDYSATTIILVGNGKGDSLKNKMIEIKSKFLALVDVADTAVLSTKLPISIDEESWKKSVNKKESWADFTFGHMPLGACLPIFSKFNNDIKSSEATILNYLAGKVGLTDDIVLNKFRVVSAPIKSYVIKGEKFETDIFLSAAADNTSNTGIKISVNGAPLGLDKEGAAKWSTIANAVGIKKYEAVASVTNPVTGEVNEYKQIFEYEVGERSVTISAAKMNVLYIGVDNPIEVSAAGVPSGQINVSMDGGDISRNGDGTFTAKVSQQGNATIYVKAPNLNSNKIFRVKRIPDPTPLLGGKERGGDIGNGTFKAHEAVIPLLEGFDFDARCNLAGFTLTRVAKRQDPESAPNRGARIEGGAAALKAKATPGDKYVFADIRCKCPGDVADRQLGQLVFDIK
ncbi:MAG: GldM family protein [Saprospiraceae bacterium]